MAEAPEWTEELVAQYHEIQGFLVLRNLPTTTGEGGGRSQADLVAFRPSKGRFKVFDIEVGTYYESTETTVNWIVDKFSSARRDLVTRAVKGLTGLKDSESIDYEPLFVDASWPTDRALKAKKALLAKRGILMRTLEDVIRDIPPQIRAWQAAAVTKKGTRPAIPRSYRSLKIVEACHWTWVVEES